MKPLLLICSTQVQTIKAAIVLPFGFFSLSKNASAATQNNFVQQSFLLHLLKNQTFLCSSFIFMSPCFSITTCMCTIITMHPIYVWSVQKQWFHKSSLSRLQLWLLFYSNTFQVINTTCGTPNSQQQTIISLGYPLRVIIPMTDY